MSKKVFCMNPDCLHEFPEHKALFVCQDCDDDCDDRAGHVNHNKVYRAFHRQDSLPWFAKALGVSSVAKCDKCEKPTFQRACPRCHYQLIGETKHGIERHPFVLAVGSPSTGKTMYLFSLLHAISRIAVDTDINAYPEDEMTRIWWSSTKAQYRKDGKIRSTTWVRSEGGRIIGMKHFDGEHLRPSLAFRITIGQKGRSVYFISPDVAGEIYTSPSPDMRRTCRKLLSRADALFFFVNPLMLSIPDIAKHIPEDKLKEFGTELITTDIIDSIVSTLREEGRSREERITLPIAVVVSHADWLLPYLEERRYDSACSWLKAGVDYRTGTTPAGNMDAQADCQRFLVECGAGDFVGKVKSSFSRYSFFFAAANEEEPRSAESHFTGPYAVVPRRVLEPLLWVFEQLGGNGR